MIGRDRHHVIGGTSPPLGLRKGHLSKLRWKRLSQTIGRGVSRPWRIKDILASTTQPSFDSKVKTYVSVCQAWQVAPWPISLESLQCFAASLKEGADKSSHGLFQSIFTYQRLHLQVDVDSVIRGAAKDYSRSISRGLGPCTLKDSFDVETLGSIAVRSEIEPFSMESEAQGRDLPLLGCWYMMRELEVASCACRVRVHPLCPVHAARRHINRVRAHELFQEQSEFPLVPREDGKTPSKHLMVQFFRIRQRRVLLPRDPMLMGSRQNVSPRPRTGGWNYNSGYNGSKDNQKGRNQSYSQGRWRQGQWSGHHSQDTGHAQEQNMSR